MFDIYKLTQNLYLKTVLSALILSSVIFGISVNVHDKATVLFLAITLLPIIIISFFDVSILLYLSISFIYVERSYSFFSYSQILLFLSCIFILFNYPFKFKYLYNPYAKYFTIFVISIIPSLFNMYGFYQPYVKLLNLVIFFLIVIALPLYLKKMKMITLVLNIFVFMSFVNSIYVIYEAVTIGGRVFGFTSVYFCDFSCIAILVLYSRILLKQNVNYEYVVCAIILIGHILTQTRNSTISLILTIFILNLFYLFNYKKFSLTRRFCISKLLKIGTVVTVCVIGIFICRPETFSRIDSTDKIRTEDLAKDLYSIGSMSSRFFLWQTALNAFKEHPYIGIGIYSFPHTSYKYNTLDKQLYKMFVEGVVPHQTEIALLAETGLLGFLGFMVFYILVYKKIIGLKNKIELTENFKLYTVLLSLNIFIFFAMIMSDAYLSRTPMVMWAVLLALTYAFEKNNYIKNNYE